MAPIMDYIICNTLVLLVLCHLQVVSGDCDVGVIVDNSFTLYANGAKLANGSEFSEKVTAVIPQDTTVIAIDAHNLQGASGFLVTSLGDIYSSNATDTPVTWRCIKKDSNAAYMVNNAWTMPGFPNDWPTCQEIGDQDTRPWVIDIDNYQPLHESARWMWNDNPGYNSINDFGKDYTDGDRDILIRGTFSLLTGCQINPDTTTTTEKTTTIETTTTTTTTTTTAAQAEAAQAAASTDTGLSTTTIVLIVILILFILALIIGIIIFCCCFRTGGAVAVNEKGIYNGRPVAHVPVTSKLGDVGDNYYVEHDGSTSNLVALPKFDTVRDQEGYHY